MGKTLLLLMALVACAGPVPGLYEPCGDRCVGRGVVCSAATNRAVYTEARLCTVECLTDCPSVDDGPAICAMNALGGRFCALACDNHTACPVGTVCWPYAISREGVPPHGVCVP